MKAELACQVLCFVFEQRHRSFENQCINLESQRQGKHLLFLKLGERACRFVTLRATPFGIMRVRTDPTAQSAGTNDVRWPETVANELKCTKSTLNAVTVFTSSVLDA